MYWVIGGKGGCGSAIANRLSMEGDRVIVSDGETDVRQEWQLNEVFRHIQSDLTGVVYCAGINYINWLGKSDLAMMRDVVNVNLVGFINLMNVLKTANDKPLRVLAISSDAGSRPLRTSIAYCASKAGLDMAVKVAARELGPLGWRINAISPGMLEGTGMSDYVDKTVPEVREWTYMEMMGYEKSQEVVEGRISVHEVAQLARDILRGPDHLNGAIVPLNGGR